MKKKTPETARPFDRALGDLIGILLRDPMFRGWAGALPSYKREGARFPPIVQMVVCLATLLYGSDRRAERELRYQWSLIRREFADAGIELGWDVPTTYHFRHYRDSVMGKEGVAGMVEVFRDMAPLEARRHGLLPDVADVDWLSPAAENVLAADGTWHHALSEVGMKFKARYDTKARRRKSRAKRGQPREIADAERMGKAAGYCYAMVMARKHATDQRPAIRMILDIIHCPAGKELKHILPRIEALHDRLPHAVAGFVYDGAMRGKHHRQLRQRGLITVNKVPGFRSKTQWRNKVNSRLSKPGRRVAMTFDGCDHELDFSASVGWNLEYDADNKHVRHGVVDMTECQRVKRSDGYHFLVTMQLYCPRQKCFHTFELDSCDYLQTVTPDKVVNLSELLRVPGMNDPRFWKTYGIRNDVENLFSIFKNVLGNGNRAGSTKRWRHELDLVVMALAHNAAYIHEYQNWERWKPIAA